MWVLGTRPILLEEQLGILSTEPSLQYLSNIDCLNVAASETFKRGERKKELLIVFQQLQKDVFKHTQERTCKRERKMKRTNLFHQQPAF